MNKLSAKEIRRRRKAALAKFDRDFQRFNGWPHIAIGLSNSKEGQVPLISVDGLRDVKLVANALRILADHLDSGKTEIYEGG